MRWNHGIIELAVAHSDHEGFGNVRCEDAARELPTRANLTFEGRLVLVAVRKREPSAPHLSDASGV